MASGHSCGPSMPGIIIRTNKVSNGRGGGAVEAGGEVFLEEQEKSRMSSTTGSLTWGIQVKPLPEPLASSQ
eukprot:1157799-Pelagomonas_calceolata.AAC.11